MSFYRTIPCEALDYDDALQIIEDNKNLTCNVIFGEDAFDKKYIYICDTDKYNLCNILLLLKLAHNIESIEEETPSRRSNIRFFFDIP